MWYVDRSFVSNMAGVASAMCATVIQRTVSLQLVVYIGSWPGSKWLLQDVKQEYSRAGNCIRRKIFGLKSP